MQNKKSAFDIVESIISESVLSGFINGKMFKNGVPKGSELEDIAIFQVSEQVVVVNINVPKRLNKLTGEFEFDEKRAEEIYAVAKGVLREVYGPGYSICTLASEICNWANMIYFKLELRHF